MPVHTGFTCIPLKGIYNLYIKIAGLTDIVICNLLNYFLTDVNYFELSNTKPLTQKNKWLFFIKRI